jgi:hypothetical protein
MPYTQGSRSAKALAEALGGKVLRLIGSEFIKKEDDLVINWGNSNADPALISLNAGNNPDCIKRNSNKLSFFQHQKEQGNEEFLPEFWTEPSGIDGYIFDAGGMVVCRTNLVGHSGAGIVIASSFGEIVEAPLYTRYIKKKDEYRVHLGREGSIIDLQRKARRFSCDTPNWLVRNHSNGFTYVRGNLNPPESVLIAAKAVLKASGLHFGAVDVIYNASQDKAYVLEINTAPGLVGQTIQSYANYFKTLCF